MGRIYLDDAAAAPLLPQVRSALSELPFANPLSPHQEGRAARAALDGARDRAARALSVEPSALTFCTSGTQAVALAILGAGRRLPLERSVVTWAHEPSAVLEAVRQLCLEGHRASVLNCDRQGRADPTQIPEDAGLVSISVANNEVGSLQPVAQVSSRARELGAVVHLDACQGPRWLAPPLELCDVASFSGAKLGAGSGGILYAPLQVRLDPLWPGGPQEFGRIAGREDLARAVALAAALEASQEQRQARAQAARPLAQRLQAALAGVGGQATGSAERLPGLASAVFYGRHGEDMLLALDLAGLAVSSGSACASGSLDPSHVLLAMGYNLDEAQAGLRISVGWDTTPAEVEAAVGIIKRVLGGRIG